MKKDHFIIINKKKLPTPSKVFDTYWKFAAERQNIFFKRRKDPENTNWTTDPILRLYKFTNAYRVSDRVSQYLVSNIIQKGDQSINEQFFRIILFKLFNKIETWEYLENKIGNLNSIEFDFNSYSKILFNLKRRGVPIYSNAYIMASGKSFFNYDFKHDNHLKLLEKMMNDNLPEILNESVCMEDAYNSLLKYSSIGPFLAYQYVTDINYGEVTNFSEMEFVKAGPGAKDGLKKCFSHFGDYSEEDIIKMVCDNQEKEFERLELEFKNLWGRRLQLIDCQNIFCEVDKYSRVAHPDVFGLSHRIRIKQKFKPRSIRSTDFVFPKKWQINTY